VAGLLGSRPLFKRASTEYDVGRELDDSVWVKSTQVSRKRLNSRLVGIVQANYFPQLAKNTYP
jgi:hypothetical protein